MRNTGGYRTKYKYRFFGFDNFKHNRIISLPQTLQKPKAYRKYNIIYIQRLCNIFFLKSPKGRFHILLYILGVQFFFNTIHSLVSPPLFFVRERFVFEDKHQGVRPRSFFQNIYIPIYLTVHYCIINNFQHVFYGNRFVGGKNYKFHVNDYY